METQASGTMPWNLVNVEESAQERLCRAFAQKASCSDRFHFQINPESAQEVPVREHLLGDRMHGCQATMMSNDFRGIPDMVIVAMSEKKKCYRNVPKGIGCSLGRINEDVSFWGGDQVAIRFQGATREHLYGTCCQRVVHLMMFAFTHSLCNGSLL